MRLYSIETGNFKLDGGAMFGVVPKSLWNKVYPADAHNMIPLAMRCLLIEDGDKLTLIDTGIGNKQSEKFFSHYHLSGDHSLDQSLKKKGFSKDDITDVFLTHLHFDHVGGAAQWNKDHTAYEPAFRHARYWSNKQHWQWALEPNAREKASFLKENITPLQAHEQLHFIELPESGPLAVSPLGFDILCVDGHTEKQMLPMIQYRGMTIIYAADLFPTTAHLPLPYVMSYDVRPLLSMREKENLLRQAADKGHYLFFEHDAYYELCRVEHTEKGIRMKDFFQCSEVFEN